MSDVTRILSKIESGDQQASEELLPLVYDELRKLAATRMANERSDHTLQATALVHEAYLRLAAAGDRRPSWDNRGHFFAAAAEAMRRILVDRARQKQGPTRGGKLKRIDLTEVSLEIQQPPANLLALHEALTKLEQQHERRAAVVKMRFFAGLTNEQIALALGVSTTTVDNDWAYSRSWLKLEMGRE